MQAHQSITNLETVIAGTLAVASSLRHLKSIHAAILRLDILYQRPHFLSAKLLRRLSDLHIPLHPYPLAFFSSLPSPNSFVWTALIRLAALSASNHHHPLPLYALMRRRWPPPPPLSFTFTALLKSAGTLADGSQIHAQCVVTGGFDAELFVQNTLIGMYVEFCDLGSARKVFDKMSVRDLISWTSLVVAYARGGRMECARELFDELPVRDLVVWTALVCGYVQNAMPKEALSVFERMREEGVVIDEVALVGAVSACALLGTAKKAVWIREVAEGCGFEKGNVVVCSAMLDMYAKCGLIDEARKLFDGMVERNVYSYSAMIVGLAAHGRAWEAIDLFNEMVKKTDVKPNHVTFIGVLTACSHAGMVDQGRYLFSRMKEEYGVSPSADHYACMVDLLGRAGLVQEALEVAKSMPGEPHGGVWGALLSACRIHSKPELARIAANNLFELEPDGIGNYVLLSNIYASAGMWAEVSKIRKLMRARGLRKNPSASWMEDKHGTFHEFFAGDVSHPRTREIKKALEELLGRLKLEGYSPILSSIVYDVSDHEKEKLLLGHSEKLALAFGLLTTGVGDTIRIMKNVRICEDCHEVMRHASRCIFREILVRDNTRFHHFKNGKCSCGEYW